MHALRLLRIFFRGLATLAFGLLFYYFAISLVILVLKITGRIVDGRLFFDLTTPSYGGLLVFQGIALAVLLALAWVRRALSLPPEARSAASR